MAFDPTEKGAYYHDDVSHVARLASLVGRRLAFPVEIMPGEGFAELLFRAISENGHQNPFIVLKLIGISPQVSVPTPYAIAGKILDCELVADVLGLGSSCSVTPLLCNLSDSAGTKVCFFGRDVRKKTFFEPYRKVSPRSLRLSNYQKAIWSVQGINFDPATGEQLLTRCPVCDSVLSFGDTYGVEQCANCFQSDGVVTDFRDHSGELIDVCDVEALNLAVELVNPEVPVGEINWRLIHDDLRQFGPGQLFELISNLAFYKNHLIHSMGRRQSAAKRMGSPHANDLAEAARAVIDWPNGFAAYAETMRDLQTQKLQRSPSRSAIHPSHPVSLASRMLERDLNKMVLTVATSARDEAALKALRSAAETADSGTSSGHLAQAFRNSYRSNVLLTAVRAAKQRNSVVSHLDVNFLLISSSVLLRRFCRRTRLPLCFIGDLISTNLLEKIDPAIDHFLGRSSEAPGVGLEARLDAVASTGRLPWVSIPLYIAISALTPRDVNPWPTVYSAILDGELKVWPHPNPRVGPTHYSVTDFNKLRIILSRAQSTLIGELPAGRDAVQSVLGLTEEKVSLLQRLKILQEDLTLSDLWTFREQYISFEEVLTRLTMTSNSSNMSVVIAQLMERNTPSIGSHRNGRGVIFWPREDVESLNGVPLAPRAVSTVF
ncbi:hypothetical protein AMJ96_CH03481 [Rhizobium sp. N113]|uniref:hypothetical protein n=1 Tax=Rhizobium sp. N113 TaxID=1703960 RepID=UPI0007EBEF7B|nr:hypothetical protein [Rhizobium sp. N113]ANL23155.1 hypothetical protein AMJ96_CH03481 [Rhizobium sp. N113]